MTAKYIQQTNLGHGVELHHGVSEGVGVGTEVRYQTKHGTVEGAVDLLQRGCCWVVNVDDWNMTKEPVMCECECESVRVCVCECVSVSV